MGFIQNSGDILNLIIALSVFVFTLFICWMLYYIVMSVKNLFQITNDVKENLEKSKTLIELVKQKIKTTFSVVSFLDDGAEKIKDIVQKYRRNKEEKISSKAKKTTDDINSTVETKTKTKSKPKKK